MTPIAPDRNSEYFPINGGSLRKLKCLSPEARIRAEYLERKLFCRFQDDQKLNRSNRSPIAGLFPGTYGVVPPVGLGRLSRLRSLIAGSDQLCSMNFRIETWSA